MPATQLRVLAVIAPMTQLNTPHPSTAHVAGFLRSRSVAAAQVDLALRLVLELLSTQGLAALRDTVRIIPTRRQSNALQHFNA